MKTSVLIFLVFVAWYPSAIAKQPAGNPRYEAVFDSMDSSSRATTLHIRSKATAAETDSRHFDFDDRFRGYNTQWSPDGNHFAITFDSGETTKLVVFRLDAAGHLSELSLLPIRKDLLPEHPEAYGGYFCDGWLSNKKFRAVGRNVALSETFMWYIFRITKDEKLEVISSELKERSSR